IDLLEKNRDTAKVDSTEEMNKNAKILVDTLKSFRVGVQSITCSRGPTITRYEIRPEVGIRVRSIANLVDDIALNLATTGVRIEAPIPGKPAVGIEVPNEMRMTVYLRELLEDSKFTEAKSRLTSALGKDVGGNPIFFDVTKMPHLLIAGATGMGKSVCINCLIVSLLYKARPSELKLILIDPKKVEFAIYKDIPHLYAPIVSDPKKAAGALASAVAEMERRFELIEQAGVRDISTYNALADGEPDMERMPHMVIVIDELADLMMTAPDEVESSICRLAQKARAAGIHLVIGTQRPSVDVITGLIKANVPSRIACTVASQVDSRTIIDIAGAEKLIGRGDMLFAPVGSAKPLRVQGAFVSETEVERIVSFIRDNNAKARYNNDFISRLEEEAAKCGMGKKGASAAADMSAVDEVEGGDEKFRDAVKLAIEEGKISTSLMQRRLGVGYGRAAKIIDTMEQMGYVSKPDGNKPRRVLITMEEYMRRVVDGNLGSTEEE
ncbi:MAG: DNA translocase FtsK, partial [Clostridia bacterium]|nr:DNA translocase FtsK [Clostridia bacterium]